MEKNKKRFKGKMSSDYNLLILAAPHYIPCQKKTGEILKRKLRVRKDSKISVFEAGCGSGHTSEIILGSDKRISLTSVDSEAGMVKQAKQRLKRYIKKKRLKIIKADALEFVRKLDSEKFDAFVAALTIHNFRFDYRKKFIKEIHRLLKPGGIFINMDRYAQDKREEFERGLNWQIGMYEKVFAELGKEDLINKWLEHEDYDRRPDVIMKMRPALSDMKAAGFKDAKFVYRKKTYSILTAMK